MSGVFEDYSKYYDILNSGKDYETEASFIINLIKKNKPDAKTILNIGCGTGRHDIFLAEAGFEITGIDQSAKMIAIAKEQFKSTDHKFLQADAKTLNLNKKFDVVISLFHVLSYQNANSDVQDFFQTIHKHLSSSGIAIFDYWYGPAVLNIKPETRVRKASTSEFNVERKATTKLIVEKNIAEVTFDFNIQNKSEKKILKEIHPMRYFFTPELDLFFSANDLKLVGEFEWPTIDRKPSLDSWSAYSIIKHS